MIDDPSVDCAEPWTKVTQTRAEYEAEARAEMAAKEAEAHSQLSEFFARHRERMESDFLRLARDLANQRGAVHLNEVPGRG